MSTSKANDHTYFIRVFSKVKQVFNIAKEVKVQIPHTIFLDQSKIWYWLFAEGDSLKSFPESFLKVELVFSYFCLKSVKNIDISELPSYDVMQQQSNLDKINYRFLIRLTPKPGIYYFFIANREMINTILNSEYSNSMDAIYASPHNQDHLLFYKVQIKKHSDKNLMSVIQRLGAKAKFLTTELWNEYLRLGLLVEKTKID